MKISEHLDYLIKAESVLDNIKSDREISKDSVDWLLSFYITLDNVNLGGLFDHALPGLLHSKYKEQLIKVKHLMLENQIYFSNAKIYLLIDREARSTERIFTEHQKILQEASDNQRDLNGKLESAWTRYADDAPEMIILRENYEDARAFYKNEQKISQNLMNDWDAEKKSLEYLLYFDASQIVSKLEEIEKSLTNINVFGNGLKKILIAESCIHFIYQIFVKVKLIEYVEYSDFINQKANNFFSFKKFAGKDKYIAYAINRISTELVAPEFALNWEKEMTEYFEINDFEKKINPSEDNKAELHLEIDGIILEAKMSQNNIKNSKKKS